MNLPRNLAALCKVTAKEENSKFAAMTCVHLRDQLNGLYRAIGTNGRVLGMIQGPFDDHEPSALCPLPAVDDAQETLLPADQLAKAVSRIKPARGERDLIMLATSGTDVAMFGCGASSKFKAGEGRFPDVGLVLPKGPPLLRIRFDPKFLISILQAAAAVNGELVEMFCYNSRKPVGIVAANDQGQAFDGLIVPLAPPEKPKIAEGTVQA